MTSITLTRHPIMQRLTCFQRKCVLIILQVHGEQSAMELARRYTKYNEQNGAEKEGE